MVAAQLATRRQGGAVGMGGRPRKQTLFLKGVGPTFLLRDSQANVVTSQGRYPITCEALDISGVPGLLVPPTLKRVTWQIFRAPYGWISLCCAVPNRRRGAWALVQRRQEIIALPRFASFKGYRPLSTLPDPLCLGEPARAVTQWFDLSIDSCLSTDVDILQIVVTAVSMLSTVSELISSLSRSPRQIWWRCPPPWRKISH